ncbi:NAD(P)H-binding protein [Solihabitans fulvus]|uniref:NAD(P)H-binding protein n=1 Tax=Solihabitans fulvus TaxID=1892852 RepID=A0A5B2WXL6_9PSEU|nr:NAD(P)H-binding protein [Solihabitans fulvus]KAA2255226.1 NAD(P)H-binding protein [Solihabitans fulvus]
MIVVTGATGAVGRPLVEVLSGLGAGVRAVTRAPGGVPPGGAQVVVGDPARPQTMAAALDGATALFLHPRAVGEAAEELVALAAEHGVRRVVALAAANVDDDLAAQPSRHRGDRNKEAEDAAVTSGLEWVSLRASSFALNALHAWGEQIRAGDTVRYVYGDFQESPIHERDLAEVAARALLGDDLLGERLTLTGPESLSHKEMVAIIGRTLGRTLNYAEVPPEAATQGMLRHGFPEPFVTALMSRYATHLDRPQHPPTGEVARVLGRPARTFAEWTADNAAVFGS